MDLLKLKDKVKEISVDGMIAKYDITFTDQSTMIINKKIPVKEFVYLRKNIQKFRKINNIIVDAEHNYKANDDLLGLL